MGVFVFGILAPFIIIQPIDISADHETNGNVRFYNSMAQRESLIRAAEGRGDQLYHDDHIAPDGSATDGQSGRLTFGSPLIEVPDPQEQRIRELQDLLRSRTATQSDLSEYLQLRDRF